MASDLGVERDVKFWGFQGREAVQDVLGKTTVYCFSSVSYTHLCLLIDVLEHLTAQDGLDLLNQMRRIARTAIVSTPKRFYAQGDLCGNPLERHVSVWTRGQLAAAGFDVYWPAKANHIAVHAASLDLKSTLRRFIWRSRCKELTPIAVYDAYQRLRYGGGDADSR